MNIHKIDRWRNNDGEISVVADERCVENATTIRIDNLKPLIITPKTSAPETVDSSTGHKNLEFKQSELLSRHINKYKCKQPQKTQTQTQAQIPTSSSNDNAIPSTSNGIPIKKIASNEKQSNKIQSNGATSGPSNALFIQKTSVVKQKSPSNEVAPSSSWPLSQKGAGATVPIVQNIQEQNM